MDEMDVNTLKTSDVALHHKRKRILNVVFAEKYVRAAGLFIQKHVDSWNELRSSGDCSTPRNLTEWSDYLVLNILCDLSFRQVLEHKGAWRELFQRYLEGHLFVHDIHLFSEFKKTSAMGGHSDFVPFTRSSLLGLLLWLKPRGLNNLFDIITPSDIKAYFACIEESVTARRTIEEGSKSLCKDGKGMRQDILHFLF